MVDPTVRADGNAQLDEQRGPQPGGTDEREHRPAAGPVTPPWVPSMKARKLERLLRGLGYEFDTSSGGSHRNGRCPGRPNVLLAAHDGAEIPPLFVWNILVKQARLTEDEVREVLRNA